MPPRRGADRIGVSLGSHRPTVILKLPCLVEKKRTKGRNDLSIYLLQPRKKNVGRLGVTSCSDLPYA
ncbi:hypothetical protein MLD38_040482 [Melastoma candidum]|nr:hypothetical protein MLD38_040482 [Melastoma candidum]